ncbi:JAB domain-containing protein [Allosphingosinicella flava]|uniref:JAB domain-containing protein n=1 Tax=Allosphingosinicella flava TaxID=2771430 RepID=UPI001CF7DB44|nr:DNA repair protein RadC [Sphingosinicella flava]
MEALLRITWPLEAARRAEHLIATFGSIEALLDAHPDEQMPHCGDWRTVSLLQAVRAVALETRRARLTAGPVLSDSHALIDYLSIAMARDHAEHLRVLCLDSDNCLLAEEIVGIGTVQEVALHPREIIRPALRVNATALILVHNHPSGSAEPSKADILATQRLAAAAGLLGIAVHDHVIIARSSWRSFRALGLIK